MNWLRKEKRLAIYLRDGLACAYCGTGLEDGIKLTLDHVVPHSHGGTNAATNLVTACHTCNSSRGNATVMAFAERVAAYRNHGLTAMIILDHIHTTTQRPLDIPGAKAILARRNGFTATMQSLTTH
jgi:hypothetical protein